MKVFKFGGASVKSAEAVRNVAEILSLYNSEKIMVVISAMAKTTNALENLLKTFIENSSQKIEIFNEIKQFHIDVLNKLIPATDKEAFIKLNKHFDNLERIINSETTAKKSEYYAEIVGFGELFSTHIVYSYLKNKSFSCDWKKATDYIITDDNIGEANVKWEIITRKISEELKPCFNNNNIIISQGFISKSENGKPTTLGREGSDYSAAIFAYGLDAEDITIWKDVPGLLNADPKYFENTQRIGTISYKETIELAYYGASIIHPKTIQPLQNKKIPLYIKSFLNPTYEGTTIQFRTYSDSLIPSFIFKKEQVLISISASDFSFIAEQNLSNIFQLISKFGLKTNMMQNSAISFSIIMDNKGPAMLDFIAELQKEFKVRYNEHLELITIRNYNQQIINDLIGSRKVYLEQKNRTTVQLLVK
ncbi:MAG: aspartate kinase [Bacteroidetes bacterium]|nr:MAG: aspartate kinase [Bacteroidota bacterium]